MGAPTPPDPSAGIASGTRVANSQQGFNAGAQASSNYNQINPFGSLSYTQTGTGPNGTPIYTANTQLTPQQQQLFDQFMGTKSTAGQQGGSLLSGANYGSQSPTKAIGDMSSGLEGQMMQAYQQGNDPMQKTAREQLDTQLRNQGLQPGEPGYDNAMRGMVTSQTQANDTAGANYAKTAYEQAAHLYGMPLDMALKESQFGAPQQPNQDFVNGAQMQPANLTGAVANQNQALQQNYQNQMSQYSGMMNGLFGIGSDALGVMTGGASLPFTSMAQGMMGGMGGGGQSYGLNDPSDPYSISDERLKENKQVVGVLPNGLRIWRFNFIGNSVPQIGLMAQEVEVLHPDAVTERNGIKMVNYAKALRN